MAIARYVRHAWYPDVAMFDTARTLHSELVITLASYHSRGDAKGNVPHSVGEVARVSVGDTIQASPALHAAA
ncbi:MAG: hypothetical protein AAF539_04960 [Planctomycetota bacterium]